MLLDQPLGADRFVSGDEVLDDRTQHVELAVVEHRHHLLALRCAECQLYGALTRSGGFPAWPVGRPARYQPTPGQPTPDISGAEEWHDRVCPSAEIRGPRAARRRLRWDGR